MKLQISINWKSQRYNSILIIINCLTIIVYYESVKVTINMFDLAKVIINIIICYQDIFKSIVMN